MLTHIHNLPYKFTAKLNILLTLSPPFLKLRIVWLRNTLAYTAISSPVVHIVF